MRPTLFPIIIVLLFFPFISNPQTNLNKFATTCDAVFQKGIEQQEMPGGVLAIVRSDTILLLKGYGRMDLATGSPVDAQTTLFQLGSVGKVFTAIASLQLVGQSKLALETDVNEYLSGWEIDNPFPTPVTLSQLLTHSAGFDERVTGYMAKSNEETEPLGQHLSRRMPMVRRVPGTEINYSNYGYGLAGLLVEKAAGLSFAEYVQDHILTPLGMEQSTYFLPSKEEVKAVYAKGYKAGEPFTEVPSFPRHAISAGSIISTGADMATFLQALLRKDSFLNNDSYKGLFSRQFSSHDLLTGYSYGWEEQNTNGHLAFAKGGSVPGFRSGIFIFPDADLGIFASVNINPTNILDSLFIPLKNYFPEKIKNKNEPLEESVPDLKKYTGIYRNNRHNPEAVEEFFQIFQSPITISINKDGGLEMILNGWAYSLHAVNDSVFVVDEEPGNYLVFSNFKNDKPNSFYTAVEFSGMDLPVSYSRLKWYETPRFLNDNFPAVIFPIIGFYLLLPIIWLIVWGVRKIKPQILKINYLSKSSHLLGLTFAGLTTWHLMGFLLQLAKRREELLFGFPSDLTFFKYVHWLVAALSIALFFQMVRIWFKREGWLGIRIYYSFFVLAAIAYVLFLHRWHFLNLAS